jgi:hypothetical protein
LRLRLLVRRERQLPALRVLVATWLIQRTHNDLTPAYYVMGAALISLLVAVLSPGRSRMEA